MTDEPTLEDLEDLEDLEKLARSVAMSGVLGGRGRLDVVIALRRLAEIDKATKRHPSNRQRQGELAGRSFALDRKPEGEKR